MDLSKFPIAIILALMPGLIAVVTVMKLTLIGRWDNFKIGIYTLMYSGAIYVLYFSFLEFALKIKRIENSTLAEIINGIKLYDVLFASVFGVLIGGIATIMSNYKLIYRFLNYINVTPKYGNHDLYYEFMKNENYEEVYVKDIQNNITYYGKVSGYSQSNTSRELELKDVSVYSYDDSKFMYNLQSLYISDAINERLVIEVPQKKIENESRQTEKGRSTKTPRSPK